MSDRKKIVRLLLRAGGIRRRLLIWGLGLFGIALTAVVVASYSYTLRQIEQDAADLQSEIASVTAGRIHTFVRRKIERFSDLAAAVSLYELGSKEQQLLASLLVKNDASFTDISIMDSRGMEVLKVSDRRVYFPSDLSDQSKSAKFNKAIKGENYISRVYTSDKAQPYVTLAIPLWGAGQSTVGVVSAEADLSFLWEAIGEIRFGTAGYAYLVNEHGNLIAHKDPLLVLKKLNLRQTDGVQKFLRTPSRSDPSPAHKGRGLIDRPVLSTYAPVPELGWAVILEEPIEAALANVERLKRYALALLATSLFVGAGAIAWVSSRMTRPIRELHEGAKTIGGGNLNYRVNIKTGDEIEWLGEEFNKMAAELEVSYATLEQKVDQRTRALSALYDRINALHDINLGITSTLNLPVLLDTMMSKIDLLLPYAAVMVWLLNKESSELERVSCRNLPEKEWKGRKSESTPEIVKTALETKAPVIVVNIQTDPRVMHPDFYRKHGLVSYLGIPLVVKDEVLGIIAVLTREEHQFSKEEVEFLSTLAGQAAIAIQNSRLYEETSQQAVELARANNAKDEFMSVMSHELRTPLNVMLGYSEMIREGFWGQINQEQKKALSKVIAQSNSLLTMINSILEATSLQVREAKLEPEEVDLGDFFDDLKLNFQVTLDKDLALDWNLSPDLPTIKTDPEKLRHVLQNIIQNAIKFTEKGSITVSVRHLPEEETVEFKVKDTGVGIDKEILPSIFEIFRQVDSSSTRKYGGAGVGLFIVQKFTEVLGGKIEVESEPGKGSIFTIRIPCQPCSMVG